MKITNISPGPRVVNTPAGSVLIEPDQSIEADLSEAEAQIAKATGWFDFSAPAEFQPVPVTATVTIISGGVGGPAGMGATLTGSGGGIGGGPGAFNPPAKLEAIHRGGGRFFIMEAGKPVGEAMSKDDAEAFNGMSDEDKAAFLKKD